MLKKKCQAVICVQRAENIEFLLLKTKSERGSFWQNVTGSLKSNEKFKSAVIREAQEETNLPLENIQSIIKLFEHNFSEKEGQETLEKVFLITCKQKWPIQISTKEHVDYKWVKLSEIKEGITKYESNYMALDMAIKVL